MSESIICAMERAEKSNKARKNGFIPGVVYGKDMDSKSVKLEQKEFKRMMQEHTKNSIVSVKIGDETKQCIIKEIQKDYVNGQILNVELQTVHSEDVIRLKIPVVFHGKEKLSGRQQLLQEYISEVEIMGKASVLPEFVSIDVGERELGDKITIKDIQVGTGIKIVDNESEILAVVTTTKEYSESEAS